MNKVCTLVKAIQRYEEVLNCTSESILAYMYSKY